jgi:hypothetical protein
VGSDGKIVDVDADGLVRRLILFDKYVLVSQRLGEFTFLAKRFGYEGLRDLLAASLIEVRCECVQLMQIGQSGMFGDPVLPLYSFKFNWIDAQDKRKYIHGCLQEFRHNSGLQAKQVVKLKGLIANSIRPLSPELRPEVFPSFQKALLTEHKFVKDAVEMTIHRKLGLRKVPFSLRVHREDEETFRIETDLHNRLKVSEFESHKIIEAALLAVAGVTQTIAEMKWYSALSGFRDEELPLFRSKLDFLTDAITTEAKEKSFRRVIDLVDFPSLPEAGQIRVDTLLKVREASETREFRDWLGSIGRSSDKEIKEQISGLRTKLGSMIEGRTGKVLRFLVNTGVGLIPGAALPALGLSAVDQFLVDKLLPRSGVAAFVNELYPSIFKRSE